MDKYIGKMLDNRYEILEIIGVGGMAMVYKARCHRLNRLVAVKILKDEFAQDDDFRRRFHAESQAVAMLSHPNIVSVFDVSRSVDVEYIVMELIDGITLKQYMQKKGALNWREALHFVTQIVKALSHAHGRGIIHRDIKPHNIMILRDGSVKVADFGIARFASKQNTLTQEALGSVHYISPEQARGSHIDARSDIYSVGVVLYEMLTSRLPYEGDSPVSVAIQHINSIPLSPKEINPDIPDALEMITLKAMSAQLSRRYSSAEVMLRDLEEFRKNPSISFDYNVADFRPAADAPDEPTRAIPGGAIQAAARQPAGQDEGTKEEERRRIRKELIEEENHKTRKSNSKMTIMIGVLGVLVFVGVVAAIVVNMIGPLFDQGASREPIEVPNFIGKIYDPQTFQNDYPGLNFEFLEEYSNTHERNMIMGQSKAYKELVSPGTTITLTISLGAERFMLPDYSDKEFRQVQIELGNLGLFYNIETTVYEASDDVTKDYVIRTDPPKGTMVARGEYVSLVVSLGPDAKMTTVPGILRLDEAAATQKLKDSNLEKGRVTLVEDDAPAGEIIAQSIPEGTQVAEKTAIDIVVSLGRTETSPSPDISPSEPPASGEPPVSTPPDASPSPSPSSSTPSSSPAQLITRTLTVSLPSGEGSTHVEVFLGGMRIYNNVVTNATGTLTLQNVQGYVGDIVEVYFDGMLWESYALE